MTSIIYAINPYRRIFNSKIKSFAKTVPKRNKILEIGSGPITYKKYFNKCEFVGSDLQNGTNVDVVADVTKLPFKNNEFDYILCFNVLEHVFEYQKAISELTRCIKPKGKLIISVPFLYPTHDEPNDFYRFTQFTLKKILSKKFKSVKIESIYYLPPINKFLKKFINMNIVISTNKK